MPAFHDWKTRADLLVTVKECFSQNNGDTWSGKHRTGMEIVWLVNVPAAAEGRSELTARSSSSRTNGTGCGIVEKICVTVPLFGWVAQD